MVTRRVSFSAGGAVLLMLALAVPMHGTESSFLNTDLLTFTGPVRLPGVTLAAGSYIFERVEASNPDVVVVRSGDRTRQYYLGYTARVEKPAGLGRDRLVMLGETRPGTPPPVTAWYPQGRVRGHGFLYPER